MVRTTTVMWMVSAAVTAVLGGCAAEASGADQAGDVEAQEAAPSTTTPSVTAPAASTPTASVPAAKPARSGGVSMQPPATVDPDLKCYSLRAYAAAGKRDEKYSVPTTPDYYVAFNIKAPWSGKQYVKSFRSLIDNAPVLHHWLLYRQLNGGEETVLGDVSGAHPDGEMLYGWAPGANDIWFDADVGMEVPAGSTFQLEMHYNNTQGAPTLDASGVEVCVTPNKPEHVAALSWVGEDRINGTSVTGHCTPENKEPVRLIMSLPHMHKKGTHMKVDLKRAAGGVETIHDRPFDFNYQRSYVYDDLWLQPGDKLSTTCTYDGPARFGKGTSDEMCYFFAIHWPAGALARKNLFTGFHGPNTCIDQ